MCSLLTSVTSLDNNNNQPHFTVALEPLRTKMELRAYHSVAPFAEEFASVLRDKVGPMHAGDTKIKATPEQKHIKQRATIILSKVKPLLVDAARKEAQLARKEDAATAEESAQTVAMVLSNALKAGPSSTIPSVAGADERDEELASLSGSSHGLTNGHAEADAEGDVDMADATARESDAPNNIGGPTIHEEMMQTDGIKIDFDASAANQEPVIDDVDGSVPALSNSGSTNPSHGHVEPPTPPRSEKDPLAPLAHGGIAWYLDQFDPQGTTIHEEEWGGRDVLRDMSEELSELDEDALNGLVDGEMQDEAAKVPGAKDTLQLPVIAAARKKASSRRKRVR